MKGEDSQRGRSGSARVQIIKELACSGRYMAESHPNSWLVIHV